MNMALGDLGIKVTEVFDCIDDLLVATETVQRHKEVLKVLYEAFRQNTLKCKPQKCHFFRREVSFLGHVIEENGVSMDRDKIEEIRHYPLPENLDELRGFLGLASL